MEIKEDEKGNKDESQYNNLIKIDLNKPEITKIILLKKEKVAFKKDEKIAVYYINNKKDKPNYVKSPIFGWILKYVSDDKKLILEPCRHDTFYVNLCIKCGFKKTEQYTDESQIKSYGFLTKDFSYSKAKVESIEKSVVNNYLEKKKLILLLDLDNTIIHTSLVRLQPKQAEALKNLYKNYFAKIPIRDEFNRINYIYVKFRPFLKTFLKNIKDKYEIFIYTLGTNEYATSIIQYINLNFEKDSLSTERMMCRVLDENGQAKHKSIKNVFPTQEKMVLIIDDHIEVWKESGENFICIHPYKFFLEKENYLDVEISLNKKNINKPSFIKNEYDNVLFCTTNLLLSVHKKFFDFYSKFKMQKSIKRIANDLFLSIFNGKKFYYHLNYYNFPICNIKKNKKRKEKPKNKNLSNQKEETDEKNINIKENNELLEANFFENNKNKEENEKIKSHDNNKTKLNDDKKDINEINMEEEKAEYQPLEIYNINSKEENENNKNNGNKIIKINDDKKDNKEINIEEEKTENQPLEIDNLKEEDKKNKNNNNDILKINDDKTDNNKINEDGEKIDKKPNKIYIRNLEEEKNNLNILKNKIEKLGGHLILEEKEKFNADMFLTDFYDEKDNVIKDLEEYNNNEKNKKIPIIHSHYIEICTMLSFQLNIEDFILSPNLKILKFLDLNQIFMKNKINIINFFGNKDFIDEN